MRKNPWKLILLAAVLAGCTQYPAVQPSPLPEATITSIPPLTETAVVPPLPELGITLVPGLDGLAVEMVPLEAGPTTEPLTFTPLEGTQAEAEARLRNLLDGLESSRLEAANAALLSFDVRIETGDNDSPYRVFRGDQPVLTQAVFGFSPVQVSAGGTDFLLRIDASDGSYMLRAAGEAQKWNGMILAAFVGEEVLTAEEVFRQEPAKMEVVVNQGEREVLRIDGGQPSPVGVLRNLWSDGAQWGVEVARAETSGESWNVIGEVYLDGQSLNAQKGYAEVFEYTLLNGKPFFFYKKDGMIGVAYDGQELALELDEVPHYLCCSPGALNPRIVDPLVAFFARRGEQWYYVQITPQE